MQGPNYLLELLTEMAGDTRLREVTELSRELFNRFVRAIETSANVRCGPHVTIQQACAIFIAIMHQRLSNREAQNVSNNPAPPSRLPSVKSLRP